ncbi:MAG: TetR-like C-terminal domain-containing protein [Anaerolineae bacterium]
MSRRAGLDQQAVIEAAAELADRDGLDALTLAALAQRLGIRTPSLYNHVDGLPGVNRDLALLGLRELAACMGSAAIGKSGDEAVLAMAAAYRAFVREHPGVYAATVRSPRLIDPNDRELQAAEAHLMEIVLAVLSAYGLEGQDGVRAARGLRSVIHGFATLEAGGGFAMPVDIDASFSWLMRVFLEGLRSVTRDG